MMGTKLLLKPGERQVYESQAAKPKTRRRGGRVRFRDDSGKWREFLTVGIRTLGDGSLEGPLSIFICPRCGWAYGNAPLNGYPCSECKTESIAEAAIYLEQQGIPLGWGHCGKDSSTIRPEWLRAMAGDVVRPKKLKD